jgi:hypothetical protein
VIDSISSAGNHGGGLSGGAIGGIVGGILGTVVLISVAALCYLIGRRGRPIVTNPVTNQEEDKGEQPTQGEVGGRLRYPTVDSNNEITEGGRVMSF